MYSHFYKTLGLANAIDILKEAMLEGANKGIITQLDHYYLVEFQHKNNKNYARKGKVTIGSKV